MNSGKKRIKQNFYTVSSHDYVRITQADRDAMTPEEKEYWRDHRYWYVAKKLPDGRLYAGWGSRYPTKLTAEDLPPDYIRVRDYKKDGYIRTAGVKSLVYHPSPFHNHAFKDDSLYISYTQDLGEFIDLWDTDNSSDTTFERCDECIWGNDIIDFIFAVEKNSPDVDVTDIKRQMVDQYNAYCAEMDEWPSHGVHKRIEKLEELIA